MTQEERLASIHADLRRMGHRALVMGGHAVRFHGVDRATIDYDLHLALDPEAWSRLSELLRAVPALSDIALQEGPSWRPADFRRFVIGRLPDGREERLECWRRNHLLPPFPGLWERRAEGTYGGRTVAFLGIDDLIRSKETEREDDWRDVGLLEEIADERRLLSAGSDEARVGALARLRSQRGFARAAAMGLLERRDLVSTALERAGHPVSRSLLLAFAPDHPRRPDPDTPPAIAVILDGPLRKVAPGSARHLALVEAVRRLHRRHAMAADRADKERSSQPASP